MPRSLAERVHISLSTGTDPARGRVWLSRQTGGAVDGELQGECVESDGLRVFLSGMNT